MADKDIEQRIVLKGEKEYSAAIKEAQRNLKVLRSELKAETAELGANATAQQKNEAKVKSLQKQIKEQEKIVKTYQAALKEVKEKYADNEEAIAKWENKLNEARATLANMKNSVDSAGGSVKNFSQDAQLGVIATKSFADSLKSVGDAAGSVATAIEGVFSSVIGTITSAIGALWGELMTIAARSDNYIDLASFLGSTATDVQKWDNAMKAVGGDISTITSMVSRLRYGGKADKVTEWFGISAENYKDDLQYFEAVMSQMVAMKDEMVANGTWDDAMSEIFGAKKVQEIDGILSDWKDIQVGLFKFDVENGGVGMSQEDILTMGEMYNKALLLQQTWESFKASFLAGAFGKLSLDLIGNAQGVLDGLIEYLNADSEGERAAAIDKIEANLTEFFTRLGEAFEAAAKALDEVGGNLADSENGYVAMIGRALQTLSDVLEWLSKPESLEQVKNFFETLIGIWAGAKMLQAISNLASLGTNLWNLFNVMGKGTGGGGGSPVVSPTGTGTGGGGGWLSTGASWLFRKAIPGLAKVAPFALPAILGIDGIVRDFEMVSEMMAKGEESLALTEERKGKFSGSQFFDIWDAMNDYLSVSGDTAHDKEKMDALVEDYWAWWNDEIESAAWDALTEMMSDEEFDAFHDAMINYRNGAHTYSTESLEEQYGPLMNALDLLTQTMEDEYNRNSMIPDSEWWKGGQNGLTSGDIAAFQGVPAMMAEAVASGVSGVRVTLDGYAVGSLVAPYVSQMIAREYP